MKGGYTKHSILLLAGLMLASAQNKELFDIDDQTIHKARYNPQPTKKVNLPRWQVGEHIIHARNLKEATKYAKKRGLYQPGIEIIPIDQPKTEK